MGRETGGIGRAIRLRVTGRVFRRLVAEGLIDVSRPLVVGGGDCAEVGTLGLRGAVVVDPAGPPRELDHEVAKYVTGEVERLTRLVGGGFTVAVALEVIEHVPPSRLLRALREIRAALVPGGTLFLTTPNAARLRNLLSLLVRGRPAGGSWRLPDDESARDRHLREYGPAEIADVLSRAGFRPVARGFLRVAPRLVTAQGVSPTERLRQLILAPLSVNGDYQWWLAEAYGWASLSPSWSSRA